jgi:two-component system, sensor histidine kinase and response regulator
VTQGVPLYARVLFADDDRSVREALARTLRQHGLLVDLAADGAEALTLAREYRYALVATDYRMPGLSDGGRASRSEGRPKSSHAPRG